MKRVLASVVAALAAAGAAAPVPAAPTAAAASGGACFWSRDITNWRDVGDRQVNLEVNHREVYRLDLAQDCPQLRFAGENLILDARGPSGPVCTSSLADIVAPRQGPLRCPVQTITRLSSDEVKALPKSQRP